MGFTKGLGQNPEDISKGLCSSQSPLAPCRVRERRAGISWWGLRKISALLTYQRLRPEVIVIVCSSEMKKLANNNSNNNNNTIKDSEYWPSIRRNNGYKSLGILIRYTNPAVWLFGHCFSGSAKSAE